MANAEFWDIDDDDKPALIADELSKLPGSDVYQVADPDEPEIEALYVKLEVAGKKARVFIDVDWGCPQLQVQFENRRGVLVLHHNPDLPPPQGDHDVDWAFIDQPERRVYLAEKVYIEEFEVEAAAMAALLNDLPDQLLKSMTVAMVENRWQRLFVDAKLITIQAEEDLLRAPLTTTIPKMTELADRIVAAFGQGQQVVQSKPRVYIGGQPAATKGHELAECQYCGMGILKLDQASCAACGAALRQ